MENNNPDKDMQNTTTDLDTENNIGDLVTTAESKGTPTTAKIPEGDSTEIFMGQWDEKQAQPDNPQPVIAESAAAQDLPRHWVEIDNKTAENSENNDKKSYGALYAFSVIALVALIAFSAYMINTVRTRSYAYDDGGSSGGRFEFKDSDDNKSADSDAFDSWYNDKYNGNTQQKQEEAKPRKEYEMPKIGADTAAVLDPDHLVADISEFVSPSVVMISCEISVFDMLNEGSFGYTDGSGIVLSENGFILTNNHVIADSERVFIRFFDQEDKEYEAELVGSDPIRDLAVIKVERQDCVAAKFGNSDELRTGDIAIAIGNAMGEGSGTTTQGIISATHRNLYLESGHRQEFIQTDAAINPGNSGGALVNRGGEVIGINTLKYTVAGFDEQGSSIPAEGIGYAIPINEALSIVETLIKTGNVSRPALGVSVVDLSESELAELGAPEGVLVVNVVEGSPAAAAGIVKNDIVTFVGDVAASSIEKMTSEIGKYFVDDTVVLTIWREGETIKLNVVLKDMSNIDYRS